ncbi:hypothetical protein LTR27_000728 [Elasticomyces elasticus]|nr:hypothetical protein LTR27_000728 [Elasticomyces elasticus]
MIDHLLGYVKKASFGRLNESGNPNNHAVDTIADYRFRNPFLLAEALHALGDDPDPVNIGNRVVEDGNKRLAWVGDSVIDLVFRTQWYPGDESRGSAMGRWYRDMTENRWLGGVGFNLGIDRHCFVSEGKCLVDITKGQMADTVEALIGAVWLDSDGNAGEVMRIMRVMGLECPAEHTLPIRPVILARSGGVPLEKDKHTSLVQ